MNCIIVIKVGVKEITEAGLGTEEGSVDGVVVRESVGAVDASGLNRMVRLRVENRVHVVASAPTHSLHSLSRPLARA